MSLPECLGRPILPYGRFYVSVRVCMNNCTFILRTLTEVLAFNFYNNLIIFILLEDISFRKYFRPSGIFFKLLFPVSSVLLQNGPVFLKNISISNNLIINHLWNSIKIYLKKDENKFAGFEKVRTFASAIENKTTATQNEFFERF